MDGELDFVEGDVFGFLRIAFQNLGIGTDRCCMVKRAIEGLRVAFRRFQQVNTTAPLASATSSTTTICRASSTGSSSTPTCSIPAPISSRPDMTLEEAQLAKKRHIAAKLRLTPGQTVLDIGSRLGRARRSISPATSRRDVLGRHAVRPSSMRSPPSAPQAQGWTTSVHFELQDYRDARRSASTASSRSACSSMSASTTTAPSSTSARRC